MTEATDVQRYADAIMTMIRQDQDSGQVPRDVCTWDELDNSVDTDDYYRQARLPSGTSEAIDLRHAVGEEVGRRLTASQGGPWRVIWTSPDGHARDIGRTTGYATPAQAGAAGREYLASHGGAYQVHGS